MHPWVAWSKNRKPMKQLGEKETWHENQYEVLKQPDTVAFKAGALF